MAVRTPLEAGVRLPPGDPALSAGLVGRSVPTVVTVDGLVIVPYMNRVRED